MSKWDGLNRRKFPRINFPCLVVVEPKEAQKETILSHTENVGIGGVCLILKHNIKIFSQIDIELDLMDLKDHVKCKGKIVWNVRRKRELKDKPMFYDIGVEFIDLKPADQRRLEEITKKFIEDKKDGPRAV